MAMTVTTNEMLFKINSFINGVEINNNKCVQFRDLKSFKLHPYASTAPSAGIRAAVSLLWLHLHTLYYYEHLTP